MQNPVAMQRALLALRIKDDVVIATMYGQLFAQVEKLPMKASPAEPPSR